jgi:hypothetical protein
MNNLTNEKYIKLRDLILASEGRTIEDELGFGCYVFHTFIIQKEKIWEKMGRVAQEYDASGGRCYQVVACEDNGPQFMCSFFSADDDVEILGQPIYEGRLLMALRGKGYYTIDINGDLNFEDELMGITFQLNKPLHLQKEEVWDSLTDILTKES